MSSESNIVILAAGVSSRMKQSLRDRDPGTEGEVDISPDIPKAMIPVGPEQRPFLDYLLLNVARAGYAAAVIVVSDSDVPVRERYAEPHYIGLPFGLRISFAVQAIPAGRDKPAGTADALQRALESRPEWEGTKVTVCNSDNLYPVRALQALLESDHENSMIAFDGAALGMPREKIEKFAVIKADSDGCVLDIIEKPGAAAYGNTADEAGRISISMNLFRFSRDMIVPILNEVPFHPVRDEKELPDAVRMLIARRPGSLLAFPLSASVPDITSAGDIPAVIRYIRRNYPVFG